MWPRIINIVVGIWLMVAPAVLGYGAPAATNDRIIGPLAASFATIAIWETTRQVRRINWALGTWLLIAPWLLGYGELAPVVNSMIAGVLLIAFASLRGPIKQRFGGGWSSLWTSAGGNTG
ncbi:MAG TPA: SPW repeat protein [Thermomicrobiales bacterium]|nr:SPW repeat protein [Thermomicrobiales bacterium]